MTKKKVRPKERTMTTTNANTARDRRNYRKACLAGRGFQVGNRKTSLSAAAKRMGWTIEYQDYIDQQEFLIARDHDGRRFGVTRDGSVPELHRLRQPWAANLDLDD